MLRGNFRIVENQEKATCGLSYNLTLTGNKDDAVLNKIVAKTDARMKIDDIHWYVPHYTPSIPQQGLLSKQILSKTPTELRFIERCVFMKEVNNQILLNFELVSFESMNNPIWILMGFQKQYRQDSQNLNNDIFCRLLVTSGQCRIGTDKYCDAAILLNYDDDDNSQDYGRIDEAFRSLTKGDIL